MTIVAIRVALGIQQKGREPSLAADGLRYGRLMFAAGLTNANVTYRINVAWSRLGLADCICAVVVGSGSKVTAFVF